MKLEEHALPQLLIIFRWKEIPEFLAMKESSQKFYAKRSILSQLESWITCPNDLLYYILLEILVFIGFHLQIWVCLNML